MAMPGARIHLILLASKQSRRQVQQILCSPDPVANWQKAMEGGDLNDEVQACNTDIDQNNRVADELGVSGTPAIINAAGHLLEGVPTSEFLHEFAAGGALRFPMGIPEISRQ